jgi:uncharacterized protein
MTNSFFPKTIFFALTILVLLALIKLFNLSYPVEIANTNKTTELSVVGEGKVDVVPNIAYVDLGISVTNVPTVEEAQKNIDLTNNKIIDSVLKLGIKKADIKTSNYSIFPNTVYDSTQSKTTGYNGNVTVNIKVTNIQLASKVIEEATKAGANQVDGTRFEVESPEKYREEARNKAIANAKEQAQKLAKTLDIKLGKVTNIIEVNDTNGYQPMMQKSAVALLGGGGGGAQLESGTQTVSSVVTLYFEKK